MNINKGIIGTLPPVNKLRYKKGDLIVKQGDYGVSLYKIISGKVVVYLEDGKREIPLTVLGPGEIIGEVSFFMIGIEPRSASARVMEEAEVEVWHPALLAKEYEQMPAILKYVADQLIKRLIRTNKLMVTLTTQLPHTSKKDECPAEPRDTRRMYYRKQLDLPCYYKPVGAPEKVRLSGNIKNISLTGLGMVVSSKNAINFSHDPGSHFHINAVLPGNREIHVTGKVVSLRKARAPGLLFVGISFVDLSEDSRKKLGFFMMP